MGKDALVRAEERQLRFLIRDFVELQKMLHAVKDAEKKISHQQSTVIKKEIDEILKSVRGGLFAGEGRIEYKMARNFQHLVEIIAKASVELDYSEYHKISNILQRAHVYNAELEKLGSRGGEIEQSLEQAKNDPANRERLRKTEVLIERALRANRAFEAIVEELLSESKKIRILKSKLKVNEYRKRLALTTAITGKNALLLYDKENLDLIYRDFHGLVVASNFKAIREYEKGITAHFFDSHYEQIKRLNYVQDRTLKESIYGYCELVGPFPREKFCGAYEIFRIAAREGFGPFFFELVFCYASQYRRPVVLDRKNIGPAARKVWEYFDTHRRVVLAYPAALSKYPELVGFTKKQALDTFGSTGVLSSTFDQFGYPSNMPAEKKEQLKEKYQDETFGSQYSFMKKEASAQTNRVVGGLASLDKAFYYDGEINMFKELMARGKEEGSLERENLEIAGEAFFQNSKSRTG